jgi:hypothetical protein
MACIGADGTTLSPGLIFEELHSNIRDTWMEEITKETSMFVTSSPTGWSNNNIGLAWLSQVFDQYTNKKAGRCWRLFLLDGHGSHITKSFLAFCDCNKILLIMYPPHATYSLPALDVVMFKFLSSQYSKKLTNYTHKSLGILLLKKGNFIPLFWSARISSFAEKPIFKAFEATGVWPRNRKAVLKRFKHRKPTNLNNSNSYISLMESDWRRLKHVVQLAVKKGAENQAYQITQALYHYQV